LLGLRRVHADIAALIRCTVPVPTMNAMPTRSGIVPVQDCYNLCLGGGSNRTPSMRPGQAADVRKPDRRLCPEKSGLVPERGGVALLQRLADRGLGCCADRRVRTGRPLSRLRRTLTDSLSLSSTSALRMLRASRKISTQDNSST
jgi:hypothetical protein